MFTQSYGQTVTPLSKTSCFAPQSSSPFLLGDRPLLWCGRITVRAGVGQWGGGGIACPTAVVIKPKWKPLPS